MKDRLETRNGVGPTQKSQMPDGGLTNMLAGLGHAQALTPEGQEMVADDVNRKTAHVVQVLEGMEPNKLDAKIKQVSPFALQHINSLVTNNLSHFPEFTEGVFSEQMKKNWVGRLTAFKFTAEGFGGTSMFNPEASLNEDDLNNGIVAVMTANGSFMVVGRNALQGMAYGVYTTIEHRMNAPQPKTDLSKKTFTLRSGEQAVLPRKDEELYTDGAIQRTSRVMAAYFLPMTPDQSEETEKAIIRQFVDLVGRATQAVDKGTLHTRIGAIVTELARRSRMLE